MELEGKISVVMPANSGISQRTGNAWMSQEFLMAYYWFPNQTQPSYIVLRVFGEDRIKQWNLQPNDEVKVRFHCDAHENNGRWYNELRIDAVTFIGASAGKNQQVLPPAQPQQDGGSGAAPSAAAPTTGEAPQPVQQPQNQEGGKADDLPF